MEDPLPMARVVMEKHRGDVDSALKFIRRQSKAAKNDVLRKFWEDVESILAQAEAKPDNKARKRTVNKK